jgi:hypothetical protein
MNTDPDKLRALLDDVLPASIEHCGPSCADVLSMLRHERQRRSRQRTSAAMLTLLIIATSALLWQHEAAVEAPIVHAPNKPKPIVIQTVNDEQLLALLQDTPAALMKMPDGSSKLFIIQP